MIENKKIPLLFVLLKNVKALSVNILTVEQIYDSEVSNVTFVSKNTDSRPLYSINNKSFLENDELLVKFDKSTFLPNQITFK